MEAKADLNNMSTACAHSSSAGSAKQAAVQRHYPLSSCEMKSALGFVQLALPCCHTWLAESEAATAWRLRPGGMALSAS